MTPCERNGFPAELFRRRVRGALRVGFGIYPRPVPHDCIAILIRIDLVKVNFWFPQRFGPAVDVTRNAGRPGCQNVARCQQSQCKMCLVHAVLLH